MKKLEIQLPENLAAVQEQFQLQDVAWIVQMIERGLEEVDQGQTVSHEEALREIRSWQS